MISRRWWHNNLIFVLIVVNITLGIYIFESGPSQTFSLFIIASIIGISMYTICHLLHSVLPKILKDSKGIGYYVLLVLQWRWYLTLDKKEMLILDEEKSEKVNKTITVRNFLCSDSYIYLHSMSLIILLLSLQNESYWLNIGLLLQVQTVLVIVNIAVCVLIAIA